MVASRASVQSTRDRLREFYEYRGTASLIERPYFVVRGDDITYFFDGSVDSTEFVSEVISDGSLFRRLGAQFIRHARQFRPIFHLSPNTDIISIPVPQQNPPGTIILRSRISVVEFDNEAVYKFPLEKEIQIDAAVETRRELPPEVNSPKLIEVDRAFPFVCEEFISGQTVRNTLESWPYIMAALQNLTKLYDSRELEYIPMRKILANYRKKYDEEIVHQALEVIERLSLPDTLAFGQIHGDLAVRNLRYNNDCVYILDWQDFRRDFLIHDFFRPIHRIASKNNQPEIYLQMITGKGKPHQIATEYSQHIGSLAFGNSEFYDGLPLFYLLCILDTQSSEVGHWWAKTLETLVKKLDTTNDSQR